MDSEVAIECVFDFEDEDGQVQPWAGHCPLRAGLLHGALPAPAHAAVVASAARGFPLIMSQLPAGAPAGAGQLAIGWQQQHPHTQQHREADMAPPARRTYSGAAGAARPGSGLGWGWGAAGAPAGIPAAGGLAGFGGNAALQLQVLLAVSQLGSGGTAQGPASPSKPAHTAASDAQALAAELRRRGLVARVMAPCRSAAAAAAAAAAAPAAAGPEDDGTRQSRDGAGAAGAAWRSAGAGVAEWMNCDPYVEVLQPPPQPQAHAFSGGSSWRTTYHGTGSGGGAGDGLSPGSCPAAPGGSRALQQHADATAATASAGEPLLVVPGLRGLFAVAWPTPQYAAAAAALPETYVGPRAPLLAAVAAAATALEGYFVSLGQEVPPWRRAAAMLARWQPGVCVELPPPAPVASVGAPTPGAAAIASGVRCAVVGATAAAGGRAGAGSGGGMVRSSSAAMDLHRLPQQQPQQQQQAEPYEEAKAAAPASLPSAAAAAVQGDAPAAVGAGPAAQELQPLLVPLELQRLDSDIGSRSSTCGSSTCGSSTCGTTTGGSSTCSGGSSTSSVCCGSDVAEEVAALVAEVEAVAATAEAAAPPDATAGPVVASGLCAISSSGGAVAAQQAQLKAVAAGLKGAVATAAAAATAVAVATRLGHRCAAADLDGMGNGSGSCGVFTVRSAARKLLLRQLDPPPQLQQQPPPQQQQQPPRTPVACPAATRMRAPPLPPPVRMVQVLGFDVRRLD